MSKKITFNAISNETINTLSNYHVAITELKIARKNHKDIIDDLQSKKADIIKKRDEAIASGMSTDEAIAKFDLLPIDKDITAENVRYKKEVEPLNNDKKKGLKFVPQNLYEAYCLVMIEGKTDTKGSYTVTKKNKVTTVTVEKSFNNSLREFINNVGGEGSENNTAIRKFADIMKVRISGGKASRNIDEYLVAKNKNTFNDTVMLALLQYLIVDKKILAVDWDNGATLSRVEYDNVTTEA